MVLILCRFSADSVQILSIKNDGTQKSLTTVTSQRAQGAVYAVVVTDSGYGLAASYVSSITYGCNYTAGDCSLECKWQGLWVLLHLVSNNDHMHVPIKRLTSLVNTPSM